MRTVGPDRSGQRSGPAGEKPTAGPSRTGAHVALRSLQRSAGNAAVTRIIAGARRLQRTPTALADVAVAKRKALYLDTRDVKWSGIDGGIKSLFTNKDVIVHPRAGLTVNTTFGGAMAKPGGGDADEKKVRTGLERVGMLTFNLDDRSRPTGAADPVVDSVHFLDLELAPFGGVDGHYRFTVVVTKKVADTPAEVDLIIENVKPRISLAGTLDSDKRAQLQKRFDQAGQKRGGDDDSIGADPAPKWQDAEWDRVLQATAFIPDAMLSRVPGVVWTRGSGASHTKEAGLYEETPVGGGKPPKRTLTLYSNAFSSDGELVWTVVHEFRHGRDFAGGTRLSATPAWHTAALGALGKAVTEYGRTAWQEDYADSYAMFVTEPETMKLLRPELFAWFEKQQKDEEEAAAKRAKAGSTK
jgi:hypothetical protein